MSDIAGRLAVQSWCFRETKDNGKVVEVVRSLGLSHIELCRSHCDFNKPEVFDDVIGIYRDGKVGIVSIGVELLGPDEEACRKRFEFARKAGCRVISVDFSPATFPATLPVVYKLCDEYGIKLAIHNHGGGHWLGGMQMLDWVFSITRPCIGLNMDTAWAIDSRGDPVKWVEKYAARLCALHIKDFIYERLRRPKDVIVGTGNLDLPALFAALKQINFDGEMILEYEGNPANPVPALKECVEAIRKTWGNR